MSVWVIVNLEYLGLAEELGVARQTQRVKKLRNDEVLEPHVVSLMVFLLMLIESLCRFCLLMLGHTER